MDRLIVAKKLTIVSLATNLFLAVFKIVGGWIGHSSVVIADGIDSLSDLLTTSLAYIGVRISAKEADDEHPYGHERFEAILGKLLALFLFAVAMAVAVGAVEELRHPTVAAPTLIAMLAAFVSIIGKILLSRYVVTQARKIKSSVYEADGKNYMNDVLSSVLSLSGAFLATRGWTIFQPLFSLFIAFNILRVAFELYRESISDLTDRAAAPDVIADLRHTILENHRVRAIDNLKTRMHGKKIYVDVEIAVEWSLTLLDAHHIAEEVHDAIEDNFSDVKHVMVHVNPAKRN